MRDQESLDIPTAVRRAVFQRDMGCRLCGRTNNLVLHHVNYGGTGQRRRHDPDGIITLGGAYDHTCHQYVHSDKTKWQPLLQAVILLPGVTGLGLHRWLSAGTDPKTLGLPEDLAEKLGALGLGGTYTRPWRP